MSKNFNFLLVKQTMKKLGITQQDLADFLTSKGIVTPIDTVKSWFRSDDSRRAVPEIPRIKLIGEFLKLDANQMILGFDDVIPVKQIPIVGSASCGIPDANALQETDIYTYTLAKDWNSEMYAVIANGDSMSPMIEDGDQVICDPALDIMDGDLVHYQVNGESAIKIYKKDTKNKQHVFIPVNQDFEAKRFDIKMEIRMIKVTDIQRSVRNNRKARLRALGF
ncbi:S24 family peptidase [Campylobacter mucosalis]|uniref:Peptidase S24 LexA-like protein n=1 Tax=Campylobacter mucosalis CCUG 21559 TaxID=1032067 RepID=A0A6G5QG93_9BACT|nr:S24 family peptidase [Campylobacter mucosalis]QCD44690.1 peptidase S24 LexA-like protein [Campylobacter mucosalis CCUG 21559]